MQVVKGTHRLEASRLGSRPGFLICQLCDPAQVPSPSKLQFPRLEDRLIRWLLLPWDLVRAQ